MKYAWLLLLVQVFTSSAKTDLLPAFETLGKGGVKAFISMTPAQRFAAHLNTFSEAVRDIRNQTTIKPGENMGLNTVGSLFEMLRARGSKGVMAVVENLSNRQLDEPEFHARCGFLDPEFGEQTILPGEMDVFMMHNKNRGLTSSCGSLSWQIMDGHGRPHKMPGGMGLRLFLTWSSLDSVRSNKCAQDKRNEFVVGFEKIAIDENGHGMESWRKKAVYKKFHTDDMVEQVTRETEGNSLTALVTSPDGELQVRVVMGPNCQSKIHLELLGKGLATMKILAADQDEYTRDEIWEQMIRQSWLDIVNTINRDSALYGIGLAPLQLDPLMPEPINIDQEMVGYQVKLSMWNVTVVGIQDIELDRLTLKRGRGLNNLREEAVLGLGDLEVRGMYQYTAECTAWICVISQFDSEGPQPFSIRMSNATFSVNVNMDTVNGCGATNSLVLSDFQLPLEYDEISFDFTNIGSVLGAAVSLIGSFAIDFGRGLIVDGVKKVITEQLPSLLCDDDLNRNITLMPPLNPTPISTVGPWHDILEAAHGGWGIDSLRRDRLSEMLVMKVWNDGLAKHFANQSSALVKALDPFQLLPASEDIHQRGVLKGHIVACELFLHGLKGLQLSDMKLVRNSDLTFSALRLTVDLPNASLLGKFRLNHVYVMSVFKAKDSEGSITADLTGIQVVLTVVMNTTPVLSERENSKIKIDKFEVEFKHADARLDVKGLGGKIIQKLSNSAIRKLGDDVLKMQQETIATEVKNIFWGLAKCLMYNPGQEFQKCVDGFWECLGFDVPFKFPTCPEMYTTADAEIARFPTYRAYLNEYKANATAKADMVAQRMCLAKP